MDFGVNSDIKAIVIQYAVGNTEGAPAADHEAIVRSTIDAYLDDEDALASFRN